MIEIRTAMIPMTTSNSTSVKPLQSWRRDFMGDLSYVRDSSESSLKKTIDY
jgi:hypothetical protein